MLPVGNNVPVKSKFQHPPPRAFDAFSCLGGREFDHHSQGVGNLIASLDVMLRDKSWRRPAGMFCRLQDSIITGKPLALKIINNPYTRQVLLHKVVGIFHKVSQVATQGTNFIVCLKQISKYSVYFYLSIPSFHSNRCHPLRTLGSVGY